MTSEELIHSLAQKHTSVSYLLIAIMAVIIILAGIGGYVSLKFYDAAMQRAEKQEERYNQDRKDFLTQLQTHDAERDAIVKQQAETLSQMAKRQIQYAQKIDAVNHITTETEAVGALNSAYHFVFDPSSVTQLNMITITKIEHDQLQLDLTDETQLYTSEHQRCETLDNDLKAARGTIDACQKTVDDYKKVAKASKFKRIMKGAGIGALTVAAFILGRKI